MSYGQWGDYVSVAERRAKAERELARLSKAGQRMSPVTIEGRTIAKTFWGKAWCDNLETYKDYEYRLPRGRTYVRNGSVIDLQIAPSSVKAMVMGAAAYRVSVTISPLPAARWTALCEECAGSIDSVVELLQGRFSEGVMERLCRRDSGLFPKPSEIKLSCSCLDYSDMCKHVAAALYGVGARLDKQPELLFRLRSVDEKALVGGCKSSLPFLTTGAPKSAILAATDLSALFGLDIAKTEAATASGAEGLPKARPKARGAETTDPHAATVLKNKTVLAKGNSPALNAPTAPSTDKRLLTSDRKPKRVRGSKPSQIISEVARPPTSAMRHIATTAAPKPKTGAKISAQPVSKPRARSSRSKTA